MNTIYLVRHGIAEDTNLLRPDSERALTPEGIEKMHRIGQRLYQMGIQPNLIISSPYKRAVQTADILAEELRYIGERFQDNRITPSARYESFSSLFQEYKSYREIMFVTHDPCVSILAGQLCGAATYNIEFKKGGVACIGIGRQNPPVGTLLWYAPPRVLITE
ncbi:MAG: phosphohistidine phosphatase SixA [Bacteroidota bacterium]|nr:phosphohistidine phosphatase SixA [Candidatus Kapabacteria bacterium]MDW8220858.1 phosphohistidine phosphatase SixA [Bacteroidota bacterium]